jgi:hypothetical protein
MGVFRLWGRKGHPGENGRIKKTHTRGGWVIPEISYVSLKSQCVEDRCMTRVILPSVNIYVKGSVGYFSCSIKEGGSFLLGCLKPDLCQMIFGQLP